MSEKWMREHVDQLKRQVRCKLSKATSMAYTVMLVDVLERLHIDDHFRDEITVALQHVLLLHHKEHADSVAAADLLHLESLRFRLLRQHGFLVSAGNSEYNSISLQFCRRIFCYIYVHIDIE
jgi:ribosome-associated translation inhibitor RaiA